MKKMKVIEVKTAYEKSMPIMLVGAPIEDVKAILKFRREAEPIYKAWETALKDAIEKLKPADGEAKEIKVSELDALLNEALREEMMREVEITPLAISEDGEATILSQSKISAGDWDVFKALVAEQPEAKEKKTVKKK